MAITRRLALASAAAAASLGLGATLAAAQERYPRIRNAMREIEDAKRELEAAGHDFGGHKADAIRACDNAIQQLRIALAAAPRR